MEEQPMDIPERIRNINERLNALEQTDKDEIFEHLITIHDSIEVLTERLDFLVWDSKRLKSDPEDVLKYHPDVFDWVFSDEILEGNFKNKAERLPG